MSNISKVYFVSRRFLRDEVILEECLKNLRLAYVKRKGNFFLNNEVVIEKTGNHYTLIGEKDTLHELQDRLFRKYQMIAATRNIDTNLSHAEKPNIGELFQEKRMMIHKRAKELGYTVREVQEENQIKIVLVKRTYA